MGKFQTMARQLTALLLALFMAGAATAGEPLVLGSYAYPALDRERALTPLAALVETTFGQPVDIRLYKDPDAIAAAVAAGEVDVAVLNLGAWLRAASTPDVQPLAVLLPAPEVADRYRAVLLAHPQTGFTHVEQVVSGSSGLRLAAVLPGSTSGGLVQLAALTDAGGAPPRWRSVAYAGSHEAALAMLVRGEADLATIAESPWRAWLAANPAPADRPRQIWRSEPLPPGPVVCRQSARIACPKLAVALTGDNPAARSAAQALATGWPELAGADRFLAYDAARYAGLIAAGMPDFETGDQRR